jgi:FkbM family methyltransferase
MSIYRVSYAQNKEDIILSGFFTGFKSGFYVDVGANHPDTLSITKYFYEQGWHGINIEPNEDLCKLIQAQRPRDINLNVGAADTPGELTLRSYPNGDGLSSFSKEAQQQYQKEGNEYRRNTLEYEDRTVKVMTLKQVFEENQVDAINFINIDVEGFEYNVIEGNDWEKYRPQVICIEANHIIKDWRPLLKQAHYSLVFFDGLNNYYVADERSDIAENFSYVNTVLLGDPIMPAALNQRLNEICNQLDNAENRLVQANLIQQNLRAEIHQLHAQLASNRRIRALIKQIVAVINQAILTHIEKLNKPKTRHQPSLEVSNEMSPEQLIAAIETYDLEMYYNLKFSPPLTYKLVNGGYMTAYNTLKNLARKLVRLIKGGH